MSRPPTGYHNTPNSKFQLDQFIGGRSIQLREMSEQTRAAWYAMRPDVFVGTVDNKDLVAHHQEFGQLLDTTKLQHYNLYFSLVNAGKSAAILDTVYSTLFFKGEVLRTDRCMQGQYLQEGGSVIQNMELILRKDSANFVCIESHYSWSDAANHAESFVYKKCLRIQWDSARWHSYWIPTTEFESRISSAPDSLKFEGKRAVGRMGGHIAGAIMKKLDEVVERSRTKRR